jgi:hypothetical protein
LLRQRRRRWQRCGMAEVRVKARSLPVHPRLGVQTLSQISCKIMVEHEKEINRTPNQVEGSPFQNPKPY